MRIVMGLRCESDRMVMGIVVTDSDQQMPSMGSPSFLQRKIVRQRLVPCRREFKVGRKSQRPDS
jgi:hypothetical protein